MNPDSMSGGPKGGVTMVVAAAAIIAIFASIIIPLAGQAGKNRERAARARAEMTEIGMMIGEYNSLPKTAKRKRGGKSILASVEDSARKSSVKRNMGQIKNLSAGKGREGADVTFTNIDARQLADLLMKLQDENVAVRKMRIKDNDMDGLWNVSLVLEGQKPAEGR